MRKSLAIGVAFGALALSATGAFASSHDIGPHTRAQIYALCQQQDGHVTSGPAQWGCEAKVWTIVCRQGGAICLIDLFGQVPDGTGVQPISYGNGDTLNPGTGTPGTGAPGTGGGHFTVPGPVTGVLGIGPSGGSDALTGVNGGGGDHGAGLQPLPGH